MIFNGNLDLLVTISQETEPHLNSLFSWLPLTALARKEQGIASSLPGGVLPDVRRTLSLSTPRSLLLPEEGVLAACAAPTGASLMAQCVKNLHANTGVTVDAGLVPGSGRSAGGGNGTLPSILAWRIRQGGLIATVHG